MSLSIDFQQDYFALFGLPQRYQVDRAALSKAYRELQQRVHPDRFAAGSERDRRLAVQYSSRINEGFETLRSAVKRAYYLLSLSGHQLDLQKTTASDPAFLLQQMELREELSQIRSEPNPEFALERMREHIDAATAAQSRQFEQLYEQSHIDEAAEVVAKMQFLQKLTEELEQLEAEILDYT